MGENNHAAKLPVQWSAAPSHAAGISAAVLASSIGFAGFSMGATVAVVLLLSNVTISLLRRWIAANIRLPVFVAVISGYAVCAALLERAYAAPAAAVLGTWLPLLAIGGLALDRAEYCAVRSTVGQAVKDGLLNGFLYLLVLTAAGCLRELLGLGTFGAGILNGGLGIRLIPEEYAVELFNRPVGGVLVVAALLALAQAIGGSRKEGRA